MIDADNQESADEILFNLLECGIETVTALVSGEAVYAEYGNGYFNYSVFIDPHMVLRFSEAGGHIEEMETLLEQYSFHTEFPYFRNLTWELADDGNGDGHPDPGENCQLTITLENLLNHADAINVHGELFNADPSLDITNPYCTFPDIPGGSSGSSTPLEFYLDPDLEPHQTTFTFTVYADSLPEPQMFEFSLALGRADWLVVDDDGGENHAEWIINSYDELGMYVDVWDGDSSITAEELSIYESVTWATGINESTLDLDEQVAVTGYLNSGGRLLLSSQFLGEDIGGTAFFNDVLHAEHTTDNVQYSWVDGIPDTPVADGMNFLLAGGGNGAANNISPSAMIPIAPAVAFLEYADQEEYAGTLYDNGSYRVIYLGFPVEAIGGGAGTNSRNEFLQAAEDWFESSESIDFEWPQTLPELFLVAHAYPNPFNPITNIELTLISDASIDIEFFNLQGALVQSISRPLLPPGVQTFQFNGSELASGIYFARIEARRQQDGKIHREQLKLNLVK